MEEESIVPDVVDTIPPNIVEVTYSDGIKVECGNELTPSQVKGVPAVSWDAEPNAFYTLLMTDPDVPTRKASKFAVLHWLVVNIPGKELDLGQVLADYLPIGPRPGSGLHRYVFLVYKQEGKIETHEEPIEATVLEGRYNFSARKYAAKHNMGEPYAGNFFQATYDDFVPVLQHYLS